MEKLSPITEMTSDNAPVKNDTSIETAKESREHERVFFGRTKDGAEVYDRPGSHFHGEGGLTPELLGEALATIDALAISIRPELAVSLRPGVAVSTRR